MPRPLLPPLAALLQRGLVCLRQGTPAALTDARAALERVLHLEPRQQDALHLLGTVSRRQGDTVAAEELYRRSLQAAPGQANVWNSLGNLLLADLGRPREAVACFEQAMAIEPGHAEAMYNRARALHADGRAVPALAAVAEVCHHLEPARHPLLPAALQLWSLLESDRGAVDQALALLDRALGLAPERAALHHNRAVALVRLGRAEEALQAHDRAAALGLDDADAHYNRGNALQSLGRLDDAVAAYRQALLRQPGHRLALGDLARLRWRLADAAFDAELMQAGLQRPLDPTPALVRGHLLGRAQRWSEAAAAFAEALGRGPGAEAHDGLGRCLVRLQRVAEGLAHHAEALALEPASAAYHANHAASLLLARHFAAAAAAAQQALTVAPDDQYAWSLLGLAWRGLGDAREHWLLGLPGSIGCVELPAPAGWATMTDFLRDLVAELDLLHRDRRAPVDQTLRDGTQTFGNILEHASPVLRALRQALAQAIDSHLAQLPRDVRHPFLARLDHGWRFADSWSARLGAQGHHVDHVHPHGWVSAAFYVQVPARCDDVQAREGWIRFGVPEADLAAVPGLDQPPLLELQPRPGRLMLFPSLMWHGTRPFAGVGPRTTVSFDVLPQTEPARPQQPWMALDSGDK